MQPEQALKDAIRTQRLKERVSKPERTNPTNTKTLGISEGFSSEADGTRTRNHRIDSQLWLFGEPPSAGQKPFS